MLVVEVMTIALRLSDTSWCLQVGVYDFETIKIFEFFESVETIERVRFRNFVCVIELSESFRAVTMVDGLPHAASYFWKIGCTKVIIARDPV